MRCVALNFSGVGHRAYQLDRDCLLQVATSSAGNVLVSDNPSAATTDVGNPGDNTNRTDVLTYTSNGSGGAGIRVENLKIPLVKDQVIYVAASTSATVFLYLEDVEPVS
jgi:hypothetical protein